MTDTGTWKRIQRAISSIEDEEDAEEVRSMIEDLPENDPDREDLSEQFSMVADGLEHRRGTT